MADTTVLPNQRIIVTGRGFTKSSRYSVTRPAFIGPAPGHVSHGCPDDVMGDSSAYYWGRITLGGVDIDWSRINYGHSIEVSSEGTWSAAIDLPLDFSTAPGVRGLRVIDCHGGTAAIDLTFPEREISITPDEGRTGSDVVIEGKNFPVSNYSGREVEIVVSYEAAGAEGDQDRLAGCGWKFHRYAAYPGRSPHSVLQHRQGRVR